MQKRGQLIFKALFIIIASTIIVVAFLQAGKSFGSQEAFYKIAVAKDIALIIDELYTLPGDIIIEYSNDLSEYTISVKGNTVKVYSTNAGETDATAGIYRFIGAEIEQVQVINPQPLIISKNKEKITLSKK